MSSIHSKVKIAPSILSADFSCLAKHIKKVEVAGADLLHVDVMDGHFVPNITIGPVVVKDLRRITKLPLDVHLMISEPLKYIDPFIKAGADMITVHIETISAAKINKLAKSLKTRGVKCGVSLNPNTPVSKIKKVLDYIDFILVMSVYPGFGGQKFITSALPKVRKLRSLFKGDISVDGGVNDKVAGDLIKAGANILVAGSFVFGAKNINKAIRSIRYAK